MQRYLARVSLDNITILGYSLAGEETVVAAPEFNVCFDIGRAPQEIISIDHVLLTHGHMDHAAGIAYYFSQRNFLGCPAGTMLLPARLADPVERLMRVWAQIEGHPSPANIVPMEPQQTYPLRRNLLVRAFGVVHGPGALGFAVIEKRHKLKPEFARYSGQELAALKQQGVQIEFDLEVPMIAYCGDTAAGDFLDLPYVSQSRIVILECTFFEPDHLVRAREGNHLHAQDLPAVMQRLQSQHVLLMHLSRRTPLHYAKKVLKELLDPQDYHRITFLMDRRHRSPRRKGSS